MTGMEADTRLKDVSMVSGVRFQVSGRGGAKYCWNVVVLVLVLDPFGNGIHKLYLSITRTRVIF